MRDSTTLQGLFFSPLSARLAHLVLQSGLDDAVWRGCTSTLKVHERLEDGWTELEEQTLRLRDATYVQLQSKIAELQTQAMSDSEALKEPFRMAKRDPEFIAEAWKLDETVRSLDRELAV